MPPYFGPVGVENESKCSLEVRAAGRHIVGHMSSIAAAARRTSGSSVGEDATHQIPLHKVVDNVPEHGCMNCLARLLAEAMVGRCWDGFAMFNVI